MGFNDQEIVALSGAHALGRCHADRSGFDGPWTFSPTVLTNDYYKLLLNEKWQWKKWDGPKQYEDKNTKSLMMLPADMALIQDKKFKAWIEKYAADNDLFFKDFSGVIVKLFELGVPFPEGSENQKMIFLSPSQNCPSPHIIITRFAQNDVFKANLPFPSPSSPVYLSIVLIPA